MDRRAFLKGCAGASLGLLTGDIFAGQPNSQNDQYFWSLPRRLVMKNGNTNEFIDTIYWANGSLIWEGYAKLCYFLRDHRRGMAVQMDPRLLDMMVAVQTWMAHLGYRSPMIALSGYRTPETNRSLEGAAKNSLHMRGMAVDFTYPGVNPTSLGMLAAYFKGGGVGFYPDSGFVHMDTGSVRYWQGQRSKIILPPK